MKKIVIDQTPFAKARPRVTRWGTYNPQKDKVNWNKAIIQEQVDEILDCPLEVDIKLFLPVPKSTSKVKTTKMLNQEIKHVKRPDLDNYLKASLDCMNEIVYKDDSQIYKLTASKQYDLNPRTEIIIIY